MTPAQRPCLEVADIVRAAGARYRETHATTLSRSQRRVLSAIERCRTAALAIMKWGFATTDEKGEVEG